MSRWHFDARPHIGPGYVQICLGVRVTIAESAYALFLDLLFFEVMLQIDREVLRG